MNDLLFIFVYISVLLGASAVFHHRYKCMKASCLSGLAASLTTIIAVGIAEGDARPMAYVGSFIYIGLGLWIVASVLSGFIGLPFQFRK